MHGSYVCKDQHNNKSQIMNNPHWLVYNLKPYMHLKFSTPMPDYTHIGGIGFTHCCNVNAVYTDYMGKLAV
jgi:hypothetical protein